MTAGEVLTLASRPSDLDIIFHNDPTSRSEFCKIFNFSPSDKDLQV